LTVEEIEALVVLWRLPTAPDIPLEAEMSPERSGSSDQRPFDRLRSKLREVATLQSAAALLSWDQETMMPPKAAEFRAEELSLIATLAHERFTDAEIGDRIAECEADAELTSDPAQAANLREMRRDWDRATKLPADLVAEMTATGSRALEAWKQARADSDFDAFRPWLDRQLELNRRKAECYGVPDEGEHYDALMEDYEPGMRAAELERLFGPLRDALVPLIAELTSSSHQPDTTPCNVPLPIEPQKAFNLRVAAGVGYDFEAGRLDASTHPFTSGLGPGDTRITTRYAEDQLTDAMYSTLHEAGHGLYEQGTRKTEHLGQPLGEAVSLGFHESQSRLWENQVGRSRAFWVWALPLAKDLFGEPLARYTVDDYYAAVNAVRPNLIRVESDEVTYNLHIMIRFDIERAMLRGDLAVSDLPGAWNERMKRDLGLDVPDDSRGCLQDVHWSMGSIGYFPTYTLGNLYAGQTWETVRAEIPDLDEQMAAGEFSILLSWLREKIHRHGRRYPPAELCWRLTGNPLGHEPLIRYLEDKLRPIYGTGA
jgi:carboxypeptidase Taq